MKRWCFVAGALLALAISAPAPAITPQADHEVKQLLAFVGTSACTFIRNGDRYTAKQAQAHLQMKYDKTRDRLNTADDFVEKIASKSYFSGEPYQIDCQGKVQNTLPWLTAELTRIRKTPKA